VAQLFEVGVAEEGVLVDVALAVESHDPAVFGDHERVDLNQRGVALDSGVIEAFNEGGELLGLVAFELQTGGEHAAHVRFETGGRMDRYADDRLGVAGGDFLDLLTAFDGGHDEGGGFATINDDGEIELARDRGLLFDEHVLDELAFGAGLNGDEILA